jgi:hypothetical protein
MSNKQTARDRILDALREGPKTSNQLRALTAGVVRWQVCEEIVQTLYSRDVIDSPDDWQWQLKQPKQRGNT